MSKPVKILVVDDSQADAELAMRALGRGGFAVQYQRFDSLAATRDALHAQSWDAIVSDFSLPNFTGMDVLEEFRSSGLDIPFILVSGTVGEETAVAAIKAGASDYLMKDRLQRLAPALQRALEEAEQRAAHRQTQRELDESRVRLLRLTRVYAVLSGINGLIVRVRNRDELFRGACRIAVDSGQLPMAWIGLVERSAMRIHPVVWCGADETYIEAMPLGLDAADSESYGLAGRAVSERAPIIANDFAGDPRVLRRAEAGQRGFRSFVALPLIVAQEVVGVLALYAAEPGFFDEDEMKLLLELAGDISFALEHIEKTDKLDYLAYYDALTGLPNRTLFRERLEQAIAAASRENRKLALILHDIERFKNINDTFGRQGGDALLRQVADRFRGAAKDPAWLGRVAVDQFGVWVPDVATEEDLARSTQERVRDTFAQPFQLGEVELRASARCGIAIYPDDGADADTLYGNAEAALKKAKARGERYLFYAQQMTERVGDRLRLESELRQALENDEFVLHYQPRVDLRSRRIVGMEALLRWQSPARGLVPPLKFIGLLEETGLILEVGAWAMRRAVQDHHRWVERKLKVPRIAVNVSAIQVRQRDFVRDVEQAIALGSTPTAIDLEITESLIMQDIQSTIEKFKAVRALGVNVAIDDFGTGYSSLAYLAKLPVTMLKIDRSFIVGLADSDATVVSTIISLARSLRLDSTAEGVETEDQAKLLWLLNCDQAQGYLFSKPVPFDQMTAMLAAGSGAGRDAVL